jgi:hypothetical protein
MADMQKQIDGERTRMRIEQENTKAELQRLEQAAAVERGAQDVDAKLARDATHSDAEKKLRDQRCQDPKVRAALAPFLAPGYYQPGQERGGYDKLPVSLAALRAAGALEPSAQGLEKLRNIAVDARDEERPRWPFQGRTLAPQQRDQVKEAQQYLIELGEEMVGLKMLAP